MKGNEMEWKNLYSPENYEHYQKVAEGIFNSRAVQQDWLPNPPAILFVMQMGIDMGISPLIALDKLRKVKKGWMLEINLARSLVAKKGGRFEILEQDAKHIKTKMVRPDWEENGVHVETITLEELQLAGTTRKDNFKSYPKQMFRAAAFRQSCSVLFSDILHGTTVADFAVERVEDFNFADDSNENVSTETVSEKDSKPKRTRRTKAEVEADKKEKELMRCVGNKEPVGASIVEEKHYEMLKEAGYKFNDRDQCWIYHDEKLNLKPAPGPLSSPAEKRAHEQSQKQSQEPPMDWDVNTKQSDNPDFNPKDMEHIEMLKDAASSFSWTPEVDKMVKSNFLTFIEGKGIKAALPSLKGALESCASQYLN